MDPIESNPAIESLLNCSVCLEPFQRPKLLRCGHTFCLECLEQLYDHTSAITCPLCKQKTLKPATGLADLTDDFRVSQIRDGLRVATQLAAPQEKCDVCRGSVASVHCLQCHKAMCNTCREKHNRRAEAASHTLLCVQDVVECGIHDDMCSHICKDCRALVCMSCVLDRCCDHECVEIGDAARNCITSGSLRDDKIKKTLSKFQGGAQKQEELFNNIQREIQSHTDRVLTAIKSEGKRLKDELTVLQKDTLEKLELSRLVAEERLVKLTSLPDTSAQSLQAGIPSELLKALPSLMADTGPDLEECKVTEVKFEATLDPAEFKLGTLVVQDVESKGKPKGDVKVFRFEKVVHDTRGGNTALIGQHGDLIARNDYKEDGTSNVNVYRKGEDAYVAQLKLLNSFPNIFTRDCRDLLPHVRPMTFKVKGYANKHGIQLTYVDPPRKGRKPSQEQTGTPCRSSLSTDRKVPEPVSPGPGGPGGPVGPGTKGKKHGPRGGKKNKPPGKAAAN